MPASDPTLADTPVARNPRVIAGRYSLLNRLGAGGMGEVFRAWDQTAQREVAVKLLLAYNADQAGTMRFQREMRHLREMNHPNIVTILDSGETEDGPFLVMEYLAGRTLREALNDAPERRWPLAQLPLVFTPLLEALAHLHSRGLIHRDLKPHNVMLANATGEVVKLMDFGLARSVEGVSAITQTGFLIGTPHYMAPEQVTGRRLDPRTDLYALGVMLYEAAVGRLPFDSPNPINVAFHHVQSLPQPPRQIEASVPPALEALILRLLEKEPAQRYASALEVAAELTQALNTPLADWHIGVKRALLQAPLVGRQAELTQALNVLAHSAAGHPAVLVVAGESGFGKSRFLEELSAIARGQGGRVVQALCAPSAAVALEPVIALLRALRSWEAATDLNTADGLVLAALLPEVAEKLNQGVSLPSLPPALERARLYDCLARQMLAEANAGQLMLILDDGQWADDLTLEWLAYLLRRLAEAQAPVLVCVGLRSEAVQSSALTEFVRLMRHAHQLTHIELRPLDEAGMNALVAGMLGHPLPALALHLHHKTEGNPFFAEELLRILVERGRLNYQADHWVWDRGVVELPAAIKEVVEERLGRLSVEARRNLGAAALLGPEFDFDILAAALPEVNEDQLLDHSDEWLKAQLVRDLPEDRFAFTHLTIQEVVADELKGPRRTRAHRRLAEAIETRRADRLDDYLGALATHYQASGDVPRALDYSLRAGTQTAARSAYTQAAQLFGSARALLEKLPTPQPELRLQVYESLGNALERAGKYEQATDAFQQAGQVLGVGQHLNVAEWRRAAELSRRMARTLGLQGKFVEAHETIALARELLPIADPAATLSQLMGDDLALAARIEIQSATLHYWQGNLMQAEAQVTSVVNHLRPMPHQRELAEGLNLLGVLQDVSGRLAEAIPSYQASLEIWRALGDDFQRIRTQDNLGVALLYVGRWAEAKTLDETGLAYWEKLGDPNQLATAHNNLGEVEFARGALAAAESHFMFARDTFETLHNPRLHIITTFNLGKVRLEQGALAEARHLGEAARDLALETQTEDYLAEGWRVLAQIYLTQGETARAIPAADESLRLARAQELKLDEAATARVLGVALAQAGQLAKAKPHLDHSLALLQNLSVPLELGRTWAALAHWQKQIGEREAAQGAAQEARVIFTHLGAELDLARLEALLSG